LTLGGVIDHRNWRQSWYCQHCLIAGVNDTGKKFIGGVVDTGENLSAVSLTTAF
jgi:hypothetical protein